MLPETAPAPLKDNAVDAELDVRQLLRDVDSLMTTLEWLEGVCQLHEFWDDTHSCRKARVALQGAISQIGNASDHIQTLMRREQ